MAKETASTRHEPAAADIRVERRSKIVPVHALPEQPKHWTLCSSDLAMLRVQYLQKGLIYRLHASTPCAFQSITKSLAKGLAQTLVHYYPLAGRFRSSTINDSVYIDCNDEGAEIVEATLETVSVDDLLQEEVSLNVRKLFQLNGAFNAHGYHLPFLVLQVTKLKDGVALGFTVNHAFMDGTSLWYFVTSFAEICRCSKLSNPPIHSRNFDIQASPPIPMKNVLNVGPYSPSGFSPPADLKEIIFHFSKETISHLKKSANEGDTHSAEGEISSFQALCAHTWQAITRARRIGDNEESLFMLPANCRRRRSPPLPDLYVGNAIQVLSVKATAAELLGNCISYSARLLNRKISAHRGAQVAERMESFRRNPSAFTFEEFSAKSNLIHMGSSPRFAMYDSDFGFGRAEGVRSGFNNKLDGKLSAYPGRLGGGSVDLEICLTVSAMAALQADPLFLCRRKEVS